MNDMFKISVITFINQIALGESLFSVCFFLSLETGSALKLNVKTLRKEISLEGGFYKQGCLNSADP